MSSTLLAIYLGHDLVGRCDVNCWDGEQRAAGRCECVCEGMNHAVGLVKAIEQTRRMRLEWIEAQRARGVRFDGVEFGVCVMHEPLFPWEEPPGDVAAYVESTPLAS